MVLRNDNLYIAASLIWLAGLVDFLDGLAARMLKVTSPFGKELDSLADLISFGLLPAIIMFRILEQNTDNELVPYFSFLIIICSAIRLAKFNLDTRQSNVFIGLPTPATALFISGLVWVLDDIMKVLNLVETSYLIIFLILIFSMLMVSEIKMMAFKFRGIAWKDNKYKYLFGIMALLILIVLHVKAISLIVICYILYSLFNKD